jgi:succinoglycan biosynthesis transport protein ExoP
MHPAQTTLLSPGQVFRLLGRHVALWLLPAVAIAAAAAVYAFVHEPVWEASQALAIRNEAFGAERGPGKFSHPDEMKTVQETILEVAKSRGVLAAALSEIGPPADCKNPQSWPGDRDIDKFRKLVKLVPPRGAEFGKTEVFYLLVRDNDRGRAVALNEAVFQQLRVRFQQLRDAKAQSMIDELDKTVRLAKADSDEATAVLAATESRLGSDLAELRSMQDMASSDSALRRSGEEIRAQLRELAAAEKINQELHAVTVEAQFDPARLATVPNRLLEGHPTLKRLKDGLIDAQLRTASMLGTMSADHPKIIAARETEAEIAGNLHQELAAVRNGLEVELRLAAGRRKLLEEQLAKTDARLGNLAHVRAEYSNQVAEAKNRAVLLERAEQNLAEARAQRASAAAASLLSRIDLPEAGIRPVGPAPWMIALGGAVGGLLAGFGLVFLVVPLESINAKSEEKAIVPAAEIKQEPAPAAALPPREYPAAAPRFTLLQALEAIARN